MSVLQGKLDHHGGDGEFYDGYHQMEPILN